MTFPPPSPPDDRLASVRAFLMVQQALAVTRADASPSEVPEEVLVEYGLRFDCARNGCASPCLEDGEVLPRGTRVPTALRVNNHAVTVVRREVGFSPWEPTADGD